MAFIVLVILCVLFGLPQQCVVVQFLEYTEKALNER